MQTASSIPAGREGARPARRIIFLHHSVGADLIKEGNVRGLLREQAPSLELWDYGYNPPRLRRLAREAARRMLGRPPSMVSHHYGLRDASGQRLGTSFHVPYDNTDPDGLAAVFAQPATNPPSNTLSHLLHFDVIGFKSCFTMLPLTSEEHLERCKRHYLAIRDVIDQHPDKLFMPMTPPPLRATLTTSEQAQRARQYARWIMSAEFRGGRANVLPYDLFDALAAAEGEPEADMLRPEYCRDDGCDTHPNAVANQRVAAHWVAFVAQVAGKTLDATPARYEQRARRT
jgi:hypothetical protein